MVRIEKERSMVTACELATRVERRLIARNEIADSFFAREAHRLACASREMADRFQRGGRLLAFGRGPCATDAQHVSVEFVHPVIVGKRALPALDLSLAFRPWLESIMSPHDIVMGFGPPEGDPEVSAALDWAADRQGMTFALPGRAGSFAANLPTADPFIHQELVEILYHTLWETVHVFLEHRELGHELGDAAFLYPFLGPNQQQTDGLLAEVASSILSKADVDAALRARVAREEAQPIGAAAVAMFERIKRGGKLIIFGNGGSATDANDWAIDCVSPPPGCRSVPAVSLSMEPANISAIANDVGTELIFLRQLIAQARATDVAVGISTSGGSRNVILALEEARKRHLLTVPSSVTTEVKSDVEGWLISRWLSGPTTFREYRRFRLRFTTSFVKLSIVWSAAMLELYGTAGCPFTQDMREWLEWKRSDFVEFDIEVDPAARERLSALAGGHRTIPVLVDRGKVVQIGWQGRGCVFGIV